MQEFQEAFEGHQSTWVEAIGHAQEATHEAEEAAEYNRAAEARAVAERKTQFDQRMGQFEDELTSSRRSST